MPEDMGKYKEDFIKEGKEHLQLLNTSLLKLEKNPKDKKGIDAIFRASHTLKSMAAAMGFTKIELLCHTMEDVLDDVKCSKIKLTDDIVQILFDCFDILEIALQRIKKDKEEPAVDIIVSRLKVYLGKMSKKEDIQGKEAIGEDLAKKPEAIQKIEDIRVDVQTLDTLMNLVEELLVNKMRLDQIKDSGKVDELPGALDVLGRLVSDMQFNVMKARMVPIEQIFNRFPRMVRDLSKKEGKEINFIVEGHDIELDRTIIDQIGEPIVHLLRNAVNHGIESKEERKKSGKKTTFPVPKIVNPAKPLDSFMILVFRGFIIISCSLIIESTANPANAFPFFTITSKSSFLASSLGTSNISCNLIIGTFIPSKTAISLFMTLFIFSSLTLTVLTIDCNGTA